MYRLNFVLRKKNAAWLKKKWNKYLYVDTVYYNSGDSQFLKFNQNTTFPGDRNPMIGQFVWRMVYYPSGDSIYINPFSATYLPTYDPKAITDSTRFATDSVVCSWYTFTAYPTPKLMADTLKQRNCHALWRCSGSKYVHKQTRTSRHKDIQA